MEENIIEKIEQEKIDKTIARAQKRASKVKKTPWCDHLDLLSQPLPTMQEVVTRISNIYYVRGRLDMAACLAIIYLTGSRASEIMRFKRDDNIVNPSIMGKQIFLVKGKEDLLGITTRVLKIRHSPRATKDPSLRHKTMYLDLTKSTGYYPLIEIIDKYIDSENIRPEHELFTKFGYDCLKAYSKRHIGWNIHFLRHLRATHLVQNHNLNDTDLRRLLGWLSAEMPVRYTHASAEKIIDKLRPLY